MRWDYSFLPALQPYLEFMLSVITGQVGNVIRFTLGSEQIVFQIQNVAGKE